MTGHVLYHVQKLILVSTVCTKGRTKESVNVAFVNLASARINPFAGVVNAKVSNKK